MIILSFLRIVLWALLAYFTVRGYIFCSDLIVELTGLDWVLIRFIGGLGMTSTIYWCLSKVKQFLSFLFNSSMVWMIVKDKKNEPVTALINVTCNFKETFSVPVMNIAVRKTFSKIADIITSKEIETPAFLQDVADSSVFKIGKYLITRVFDYADECVLAWCYSKDDTLLEECTSGIAVFQKHFIDMLTSITPIVLIHSLVRVAAVFITAWYYVFYMGVSAKTVIPAFFAILLIREFVDDAVLNPMFLEFVITKFSEYLDEDDFIDMKNNVLSLVESEIDELSRRAYGTSANKVADTPAESGKTVEEE